MSKNRTVKICLLLTLALLLTQAAGFAEAMPRLINRCADESVTGYKLYDDPEGGAPVTVQTGGFGGTFYANTYQDILRNPALTGEKREYTVMIYLCGSNLETNDGQCTESLISALSARYDPNRLNVLVLAGGTAQWQNDCMSAVNDSVHCCLYYLDPTAVADCPEDPSFWTRENADDILTGDAEDGSRKGSMRLLGRYDQVAMCESELLLGFMDTAYELFPADHYWLTLWDHGNGAAEGVCASDTEYEGSDEDDVEISGDMMTMADLEEALHSSRICREANGLDILSMDCCLMGGIEAAYNLSPYARYFTASEETTYGHVNYGRLYSGFAANAETPSARELSIAVSEVYLDEHPAEANLVSTHACCDLQALRDYGGRMDRFGRAMSALIEDPETSRETFDAFYTAAVRARSFGAVTGEVTAGYNYADMYGLLKGLYALLWEQERKASATAAGRYTEAMNAIEDLCNVPFIVYRGARMGNGYALEQTAPEGETLTIDMTGVEYQNFWKFGGFGQICGIDLFVPYKAISEEEESNDYANYVDEAIFPAYAEFLKSFYEMMRSDWRIQAQQAAEDANWDDISRLFSDISTRYYDWMDDQGQARRDIVVDVKPNHSDTEDLFASFMLASSPYVVAVLRNATVTSPETGVKKSADLIVAQSEEDIPPIVYASGELSCDADESGTVTVTDSAGVTIDTGLINFITCCVQGETEDTDEGVFAIDYGTLDTFGDMKVSAFAEQTHTRARECLPVVGTVSFVDENGKPQSREADLIFTPQDNGYIYSGAVYEEESGEDDIDYHYIGIDGGRSIITLAHYIVEDGRMIEAESRYTLNAPRFVIEGGRSLPMLYCIDPTKRTPDNTFGTEYNRYALYFEQEDNACYVDGDGDRGCVDPEQYGNYEAVGLLIDWNESVTETQGPATKMYAPKYPITPEEDAD